MEALSAAVDDNTNSVKSDDSSPQRDSGASSPPPKCAICLGTCKNKSFTDSCRHQFCFSCLLTWSKVKAECPLCKQAFRSIIHNVRSNHQYEEYLVVQRQNEESSSRIDIDSVTAAARRFRFRGTFTLPRRETIAIQQLLMHYPLIAHAYPTPTTRRRREPVAFRRTVYRHNLWARPLPDFTGRFRDCSPEFYRYNDTQMHRLAPWLNRELHYLLNENIGHIAYVMSRILELLPQHHINSHEFREAMRRYFGDRTEHFLHELYCYASTPYDMTGYDRNVQYTTDSRISTMVNEVISSSDSESADSDIVMVSSSEPGPSRPLPTPVYPPTQVNYISPANDSVIPIETISHSDTDDDSSEVMVVGYIKPPQDRTPEVVDLLGSDSDVVIQEASPETTRTSERSRREPVKLVMQRAKVEAQAVASDSDDSTYTPSPPPPRPRRHSRAAADSRSTASPTCDSDWERQSKLSINTAAATASTLPSDSESDASRSPPRKKPKASRDGSSRDRRRRCSRPRHRDRNSEPDRDRRTERKSRSGKGVKCSKRIDAAPEAPRPDQPSTSAVPIDTRLKDRKRRKRDSRESRRLRSVVNVINHRNICESLSSCSPSSVLNNPATSDVTDVDSTTDASNSRTTAESRNGGIASPACQASDSSDPEDDLPLNLTLQKKS